MLSCHQSKKQTGIQTDTVRFITLDPGHFHAALVQKTMYPGVDSVVYVYAPKGNDLQMHLERINAYNNRADHPAHWKEEVYTGPDFFEKMLSEKKGNLVVISGNNQNKTRYILQSLEAGFNVLTDKPMAISSSDFALLEKAFKIAKEKKLLLYDIMTERFEMTTILQRELSMIPEIFGVLEKGTATHPAVAMESLHFFYKNVSGKVLIRPAWFMDNEQEGDGITDVTTHLVDLVQWECFPGQSLDYTKDIKGVSAKRWPTAITAAEFNEITKLDSFPSYLKKNLLNDSLLQVYCNANINYQLRGVYASILVRWKYRDTLIPGDTHYSMMRGTKANLVIQQNEKEGYKPVLYIGSDNYNLSYQQVVEEKIKGLQAKYPGVELQRIKKGWKVLIPEKYNEGHEAHFARVTENFLEYNKYHNMPGWELPNMIAKYYTTTKALENAIKDK